MSDHHLSEEQKQALVQIYLSFRYEHERRSTAADAVPSAVGGTSQ